MRKSEAERLNAIMHEEGMQPSRAVPIITDDTPHAVVVLTNPDGKPRWTKFEDSSELQSFIEEQGSALAGRESDSYE